MKHVLFHEIRNEEGRTVSDRGRNPEPKSRGLLGGVLAKKGCHFFSLIRQLFQVDFVSDDAVKEAIKITKTFAPITGDDING